MAPEAKEARSRFGGGDTLGVISGLMNRNRGALERRRRGDSLERAIYRGPGQSIERNNALF